MPREQTYCQAPGCDEPTKEGRRFCPRDTKRDQRRRAGRSAPPLGTPPTEKLPPIERAIEAASHLIETSAEDDRLYEERRRKLEGILLSAAKELGDAATSAAISKGMKAAQARGVRIGRPLKLAGVAPMAQRLAREIGVTGAARALGVDPATLRRFIRGASAANSGTPPSRPQRSPITKRVRFEIFKRDGFRCVYCGATPMQASLHVDHVVAVVDGGSNEPTNLVTSCEECNVGKGAIPIGRRALKIAAAMKESNSQPESTRLTESTGNGKGAIPRHWMRA